MEKFYKVITAEVFAILSFLFGQWDGIMKALVAFIVLDYITGVIAAAYRKKLNSKTGSKGIAKKTMIFALVAVGHIIDSQVLGGNTTMFRSAVIGFYIANEGLSILENVGRFVKYPKKLQKFLEQLQEDSDKEGDL